MSIEFAYYEFPNLYNAVVIAATASVPGAREQGGDPNLYMGLTRSAFFLSLKIVTLRHGERYPTSS